MEKEPPRESPGGCNPFDTLPEELLRRIFGRLPHLCRLRSRCVSLQWKRVLAELEAAQPARSLCCLALEMLHEDDPPEWSVFDPVSGESPEMKLSFPPGWNSAVHGGIRGGGRSGLVALWDRTESLYWVGSPVHDKWEKVPEPYAYKQVAFHRQGFQLIGEECSGFYKIIQFQWNEAAEEQPGTGLAQKHPNWVTQVYCSKSRTWSSRETITDPPLFWHLYDSCVSGNRVYFLGSVEPPADVETIYAGTIDYPIPKPCPLVIRAFDVDTGVLSLVRPPGQLVEQGMHYPYMSSLHLQVTEHDDFELLVVGSTVNRDYHQRRLHRLKFNSRHQPSGGYRMGFDANWGVEEEVNLNQLTDSGFQSPDGWDLTFLAYNAMELMDEDYYEYAQATDFTPTNIIYQSNKGERKWGSWDICCPLYEDQEPPVVSFVPCACWKSAG